MRPKLEYGSHGDSVSEVQVRLNLVMPEAAPPLVIDGKFGSKTTVRVKEFQMSRGLVADGIVGAKTWAALEGSEPPKPGATPGAADSKSAKKRVPLGAKTFCSCGTKLSALRFSAADRKVATVLDSFAYSNVGPFGKCHSLYNPLVQLKTQANQGVFSPQPCQPAFQGGWSPSMPIELMGKPAAAAIDMNSVIVCAYGGVVSIVEKQA